jgi:Lon protease-like protein
MGMATEQGLHFPNHTGLMILPWVSLFPGGLLPLRIFEERYRHMLRDALASHRMFAIAHVEESLAGKSENDWEPLGALGVLRACVTNEDGTSNLILQGVARVEFTGTNQFPYPRADIGILRDSSDTSPTIDRLRTRIHRHIQNPPDDGSSLPKGFADHLATIESPASFADMVASTLITNPLHRRYLLEELDVTTRLEMLFDFLQNDESDFDSENENPGSETHEAETGEE